MFVYILSIFGFTVHFNGIVSLTIAREIRVALPWS